MIKFYAYPKCSTCIKAKKLLTSLKVDFKEIDITLNPPKVGELKSILDSGEYPLNKLFNTSGELYRSMKIKEKLPTLTRSQALGLLAKNGKLIKRPIIFNKNKVVVGFDEAKIKTIV